MHHFFRRVARHGVVGTIKLLPTNLRYVARILSPSAIAARRRDRDFDRRHGTITSGSIPLGAATLSPEASRESVAHAACYEPVPPELFDEIMRVFVVEVGDSVRDGAFESVGIGEGTI